MSSHLNLDSFRSKHVKILFIYVFVFLLWFDLCCLGSPTSSALRVLDIALPAVATSYSSMSTELNRPSHPSQLRFVLLKKELPTRIFGWNGWNLGLAQGSVCSTLTYKTYKLRSFKSDHPYLSTLCASILVKIRYNWSILLEFLLVTLIWSVSFEHIRIFLACGSARPSARSISAEVGRPGQRKEPAANSVNTRSTPIQVNSKGLKHLLSKISVKDDLKVEKR